VYFDSRSQRATLCVCVGHRVFSEVKKEKGGFNNNNLILKRRKK
jgi:hypothetical protein